MKKSASVIVMAGLIAAASAPGVAQDAPADNNRDLAQLCRDYYQGSEYGTGMSGRCVAYYNQSDAAAFCNLLDGWGLLDEYGFSSRGECVSAMSGN